MTNKVGEFLQSHAIGDTPEWELVPRDEHNAWQKLAAATRGVMTPGNALTAAGTIADITANAIILRNSQDRELSAKTLIAATALYATEGIFDALDGTVAKATGTRSPLGRRLDAGSDAGRIPLTIYAMTRSGILPKPATALLAAEKASTVIPSVVAGLRGNEPIVASTGKLTAGAQRFSSGAFMLSAVFHQLGVEASSTQRRRNHGAAARLCRQIGWGSLAGSVITTVPAARSYITAATARSDSKPTR